VAPQVARPRNHKRHRHGNDNDNDNDKYDYSEFYTEHATTNVNDTATQSVPELPPEVENNTTVATGAVNGEFQAP